MWRKIRVRLFFLVLFFFPFFHFLFGQGNPVSSAKLAEKIDIPNVVAISGEPYPEIRVDSNGKVLAARMVCKVTVVHKDKSVYRELITASPMNLDDDMDVMMQVRWAYDTCRDRMVEILSDMRSYKRIREKSILRAKSAGRR